jgi:bis(5'-nucleosyl)-tetraphosphatase (symmetrical)
LIALLPLDRTRDRLWLVGDLVAHGPDAIGVLRFVRELESELRARLVVVLGNHDLRLLAARAGAGVPRKVRDLLEAILAEADGVALVDWLAARPVLHYERPAMLVHAGLLPCWTLDQAHERAREVESILASPRRDAFLRSLYDSDDEDSSSSPVGRATETARVMTTIRTVKADWTLCDHKGPPESAPSECRPWFSYPRRAQDDATVVFGHWAALGLRLGADWMALDSGCAWGGPLSAVRVEDRTIYQTPRID